MIPIGTDYRMRTKPWVNYGLVAANVLFYFAGANGHNPLISHLFLQPGLPRLYQFFTSMFMHGNFQHLAGNMLFLWVFGNAVNDKLGHLAYLLFYLGGGLIAGFGYIVISGTAPVLGASGAICAVTGAYLVLLPRVQVTLLFWFILIMTFQVSSLFFLAVQFIWNMWMSANTVVGPRATGGVAYVAHSSGYIFGILVAAGLLVAKMLPRDAFDLLNLIKARRRRRAYRQVVDNGHDPYGSSHLKTRAHGGTKRKVDAKVVDISATEDTASGEELQLRRDIASATGRGDLREAGDFYQRLIRLNAEVVLPRQQQLDIANNLMATANYPQAAEAYERFLANYGGYRFLADIHLMLGLLYSRYLERYEQAVPVLEKACNGLTDPSKLKMAQDALAAAKRNLGA